VLDIILARSHNGEESLEEFSDPDPDSDVHQNLINLALPHTQPVPTKFIQNPSITFWDVVLFIVLALSLSMVKNHLINSQIWIWIRIFIKIKCCCPCLVNYIHKKFQNDCLNCGQKSCDRDRQTGKCYRPTKLPKKYFWPRNKQKDRGENITSSHLRWWR